MANNIKNKLDKAWTDGYELGEDSVLYFLKQVKNLDFRKEYELWAKSD